MGGGAGGSTGRVDGIWGMDPGGISSQDGRALVQFGQNRNRGADARKWLKNSDGLSGRPGCSLRLHFQEKPWDLYISLGYTAVMSGILLGLGAGNLPAILLVLFVPGYVLVAALFPGNKEIDWIERIALSFGLSVAVVPLLGLLLNFTPFGIRFAPIVATIALFTGLVGFAAHWRRMLIPSADRLFATLEIAGPA